MSTTSAPHHRSVSNIRQQPSANLASPSSPHTPVRTISSTFGSPSALRAEEDTIVIEVGSRYLRAGFAGQAVPKAVIDFGPEQQRRAGDYRRWEAGYEKDWRKRAQNNGWGEAYELWRPDLRGLDLGLIGEKIERAVREAYTKYLLIDSRQRRLALVIPSALPLPLLSTVLDTLFSSFQPPTISLMSAPVLTAVAAGIRSALVVDLGWAETVVSSVYEYREVQCKRSTRGAKLYGEEMYKMLAEAIDPELSRDDADDEKLEDKRQHILSFDECEEIIARVAWCKQSRTAQSEAASEGLAPVEEEDELKSSIRSLNISREAQADPYIRIPLRSTNPPRSLRIPFSQLAAPCETALFGVGRLPQDFDDEELPLHLLVYRSLLQLPVDVRSVCMSRIVFVGGGSKLLGLKERVMDDVKTLIEQRGWDPVRGKAVDQLLSNPHLQSRRKQSTSGPTEVPHEADDASSSKTSAAFAEQEPDPIDSEIKRLTRKEIEPDELGFLRAVESLGAWSGGSLLSQLKVPAVSIIDRDHWNQHGIAGASQDIDVSANAKRQSMGAAAFKSGVGDRSSWTLGVWG